MHDTPHTLSLEQARQFREDGFLVVRGLFAVHELEDLRRLCLSLAEGGERPRLLSSPNGHGQNYGYFTWTELGESLLGRLPRITRIVDGAEALLGEPCYHWHSKLVVKSAGFAGMVPWHTDYQSWRECGARSPDLVTCSLAVTANTRANGCMRVCRGSHLVGWRPAMTIGGHSGYSTPGHVEEVLQYHEVVDCELEPGDVLFFHAQTMHSSHPQGEGLVPRVLLHCTYNAVANSHDVHEHRHRFRPLVKVCDDLLVERSYASLMDDIEVDDFFGSHADAPAQG